MTLKYFIVEIFLVVIFLSSNLFAQLKVENLKCEYKSNPLGISELKPRLSWILTSSERSQYQSSYQILVSSSIDKLNNGDGDLWDSKRQISDETISVQYGGQPLCSGSRCWWKVRVWNQDNLISDWSLPGFWSIGLLTFFDWKAGWIGYDSIPYIEDTYEKVISREAEWIWKSSDYENSDICTVYFKKNFTIDSLNSIDSAIVLMTADDKFTFYLNDSLIGKTPDNGTWNNIYKYECKKYLRQGKNKINIMVENLSKSTAGLLFDFKYKNNGKICKIVSNNTWLFSLNNNSNDSLWSKVYDIGGYSVLPWGIIDGYYRYIRMPEVIYMRKSFKAKFPVDYATIYSSAKGVYHLMINGIRASNDILSPGWTDYTKRIYYQTYDLTDKINQGDNVISVSLGDGWYSGYLGPFAMREAYGSKRYFVSKLVISYKNGLMDTIVTDNSWKISDGPIRTSDILMGENYDARLENTGWNLPAFNDKSWKNADVMSINYYVDLFSHPSEPITIVQKFTPLSISEIKPGIYIFNLNQNIAGVAQIKIKNSFPGQKIIIRYGERLNNDSSLFTKNLNNARKKKHPKRLKPAPML